jgi:hypothetical protein
MRLLCATLLCVIISTANAQALKSAKRVKKVKITDVFLQQLNGYTPGVQITLDNFKEIAPQSALLNNDFTGYTVNTGNYSLSTKSFNPSLGVQFTK